jgi:hypothetical protein
MINIWRLCTETGWLVFIESGLFMYTAIYAGHTVNSHSTASVDSLHV